MNWELVTVGVFVVVGLIEYAKGFAPLASPNTWRLAIVPAAFVAAAVGQIATLQPVWPGVLLHGLVILSASQLGYQVVVEAVKRRLGGGV